MFERIKENDFFKKIKNMPRQKLIGILVIVGMVAIGGIFLSESVSTSKENEKPQSQTTRESVKEYEEKIEKKLQKILSQIEGIGVCKVMVTLESGEESVYSADIESEDQSGENNKTSSQKSKYVIVEDEGQKPVLEKEIEPKIRGVIVVCEGADDVYVRGAVVDSLRAALGISSANISVVRGGKNG